MGLQKIPHDSTKYRINPVELINISNRNRIGTTSSITKISPTMSANNSPSPYVVSASHSDLDASYPPWKAMDGDLENLSMWASNGTGPWWWKIDFNTPVIATGYKIAGYTDGFYPKAWTISASNDNSNFTVLDSQSNQVISGGLSVLYSFNNVTSYRYYKLNITENFGLTVPRLGEFVLYNTSVLKNNYIGA